LQEARRQLARLHFRYKFRQRPAYLVNDGIPFTCLTLSEKASRRIPRRVVAIE
jgi:hypothetical protein